MSIEQQLAYIVTVLNKIAEESKNIGELTLYNPSIPESDAFFAVFDASSNITGRFSMTALIAFLDSVVTSTAAHTHVVEDVDGLRYKILYDIEDANSSIWRVYKNTMNPAINTAIFEDRDKIEGWADGVTQKHWVEGIILDGTISIPTDLDDPLKFYKTNEKVFV